MNYNKIETIKKNYKVKPYLYQVKFNDEYVTDPEEEPIYYVIKETPIETSGDASGHRIYDMELTCIIADKWERYCAGMSTEELYYNQDILTASETKKVSSISKELFMDFYNSQAFIEELDQRERKIIFMDCLPGCDITPELLLELLEYTGAEWSKADLQKFTDVQEARS